MKKNFLLTLSAIVLSIAFSAFSNKRGGDVFQIYLNGKQVHQQFVHIDKSPKTIQLSSLKENDNIAVFYSHCGNSGKNRVLTIKNEKEEVVRVLKFPDAADNRSRMSFSAKDMSKIKNHKLRLYYTSQEIPDGMFLATLNWGNGQSFAKL